MPYAVEAARKNVEQEPPDKLLGGERHDALALRSVAADSRIAP